MKKLGKILQLIEDEHKRQQKKITIDTSKIHGNMDLFFEKIQFVLDTLKLNEMVMYLGLSDWKRELLVEDKTKEIDINMYRKWNKGEFS